MDETVMFRILVSTFLTVTAGLNECPAHWKQVNRQCFRLVNSLGIDSLGFPTAYHARVTCKQYGGDLAYIRDSYYENQAFSLIRMMAWDLIPRYVYIGLTDVRTAGHFEWMNEQPAGYQDWAPDEPNDGRGEFPEGCVVAKSPNNHWMSPNNTEWHDYPCCTQAYITHALCSRDLDDSPSEVGQNNSLVSGDILFQECNIVDECASSPCLNGATCLDDVMGYTCVCAYGFTGVHCELNVTCPVWGLGEATLGTVYEGDPDTPRAVDSTLSVTCRKGYSFHEAGNPISKRFKCTEDGWKLIEKIVILCPPIPIWTGIKTNHTDRTIDTFANYTCGEGRKFNDSDIYKWSVCNISGLWDPPLATCVEKETLSAQVLEVKKPVEASGAVVMGTFCLIFLVTEVVLFVLLDINVYRKQLYKGYCNIKSWIKHQRRDTQFHAVPS